MVKMETTMDRRWRFDIDTIDPPTSCKKPRKIAKTLSRSNKIFLEVQGTRTESVKKKHSNAALLSA